MPKKHSDIETRIHLTDQKIKTISIFDKRIEYYDQHLIENGRIKKKGVKGFLIRVTPAGNKYFYYSYWHNGKSKKYKIGSYPDISLSDARDRARELASDVNKGIDPQAEKNKRKRQIDPKTFSELANEFKDKYLPTLRKKTRDEYERIIDVELIPVLGKHPINEVSRNQVISLLDKKAHKEGHPTMANRIKARLSTIYNFGIERGLAEYNPVSGISSYKKGNTKRDRFYNDKEIRELWSFFSEENPVTQSVFKMLLICGQRKTETMLMKWENIQGDVWTIPAEIAKNGQPHDVPLSNMALEIIEKLRPITGKTDYVFCSPKKDNEPMKWLTRARVRIQKNSNVTDFRPHDLRRTFATHMAKLAVDRTVLGKILNHKGLAGDGQVTAIYDRHSYMKEKRQAMNRWSDKLQTILSGETAIIHKIG